MDDCCQEKAVKESAAWWRFFVRMGWISFGGPAGQIAILREEMVERCRWLSPQEFNAGLNLSLLLPGPEAHQLIIYSGWKLQGLRGALGAGTLFVLPGCILVTLLAALYAVYGALPWVQTIFSTLRPAVLVIILAALFRMGRHHLRDARSWAMAIGAFVATLVYHVPFPWVVLTALGLGMVRQMRSPMSHPEATQTTRTPFPAPPWRVLVIGIAVWLAPMILVASLFGPDNILVSLGWFFSKVAVVTFGGAYAVLPYVAEHAVQRAGWLSPSAMKDGLALAETLPGPLVKVLAFVGYLGGTTQLGPWPPWAMGLAGAAITSWVTFVPSFIFILFAAPYVDRLTHSPRAHSALETLGAAVIGVIANLGVWFGAGLFSEAQPITLNLTICLVTLWLLVMRRWNIPAVMGLIAAVGCIRAFF